MPMTWNCSHPATPFPSEQRAYISSRHIKAATSLFWPFVLSRMQITAISAILVSVACCVAGQDVTDASTTQGVDWDTPMRRTTRYGTPRSDPDPYDAQYGSRIQPPKEILEFFPFLRRPDLATMNVSEETRFYPYHPGMFYPGVDTAEILRYTVDADPISISKSNSVEEAEEKQNISASSPSPYILDGPGQYPYSPYGYIPPEYYLRRGSLPYGMLPMYDPTRPDALYPDLDGFAEPAPEPAESLPPPKAEPVASPRQRRLPPFPFGLLPPQYLPPRFLPPTRTSPAGEVIATPPPSNFLPPQFLPPRFLPPTRPPVAGEVLPPPSPNQPFLNPQYLPPARPVAEVPREVIPPSINQPFLNPQFLPPARPVAGVPAEVIPPPSANQPLLQPQLLPPAGPPEVPPPAAANLPPPEDGIEPEAPRTPYEFGYDMNDGRGTDQHRQETSDGSGAVSGSYGYRDAHGVYRVVTYVADKDGFRAVVRSNEPGVANPGSADVQVVAEVPPPAAVAEGLRATMVDAVQVPDLPPVGDLVQQASEIK